MKKILYIAVATLMLFSCGTEKEKTPHEISVAAIPTGSVMVCNIPEPSIAVASMQQSLYLKTLDSMDVVKNLKKGFELYSVLSDGLVLSKNLIIAAAPIKAKELSYLYISRIAPTEIITPHSADTTISTRTYEDKEIHTLTVPSGKLHYYHHSGMTIASTDALYIEQSVLLSTSGINMTSDAAFVKAYDKITKSDGVAVALSPSSIAHFMKTQMGLKDISLAGQLSPWVSTEISTDSTWVKMNGIFCADDSVRTYAGVLASQKESPMTLDSYFPSSTYAYTYLGINDWEKYFHQYALYLKSTAQYHQYNASVQKYDSLFKKDFKTFFTPWAGEGIAVLRMAGGEYSPLQNVVIMHTSNTDAAYTALEQIKDPSVASPDPYRSHRIIQIASPYQNILSSLINPALGEKGIKYAAIVSDAMIASHDLTLLKSAIENIETGSTLTSISTYTASREHLATATAMMTMVRADLCTKDMKDLIRTKRKTYPIRLSEAEKYIWNHGNMLSALRYTFVQISPTGGIPFLNTYGLWNTDTPREAVKAWTYMMSAAPAVSTLPFPNHKTGRIDVLCMDKNGYIYLLSDTGTLFWKKKLPAVCKGDIRIVDLYKNRKYQMAFTAGNKFYVIDRNGNPVTAADKVAAARKASPVEPTAHVSSTNTIDISRGGKKVSIKTSHSPVDKAVYLRSKDIIVYSTSTGQIYAMKSSGEELSGFPIAGTGDFTAEDFSKKGRLDIVTTSAEGAVSMHRIPLK